MDHNESSSLADLIAKGAVAVTTVAVKIGETVGIGNYENRRYDIELTATCAEGTSAEVVVTALQNEAQRLLQARKSYDQRVRSLLAGLEHGKREVAAWEAQISRFEKDPTLEPTDRFILVDKAKVGLERARQKIAQAEEKRKRNLEICAAVIQKARDHIERFTAELDNEEGREATAYRHNLQATIERIKGYARLPHTVRQKLRRVTVTGLAGLTPEQVLDNNIPASALQSSHLEDPDDTHRTFSDLMGFSNDLPDYDEFGDDELDVDDDIQF